MILLTLVFNMTCACVVYFNSYIFMGLIAFYAFYSYLFHEMREELFIFIQIISLHFFELSHSISLFFLPFVFYE